MEIGNVLRESRIKAKMSVEQVSRLLTECGFKASQKTVYSWENGNSRPDIEILMKLCDTYGIKDILKTFGYDGYKEDGSIQLNMKEIDIIEKYRFISTHSPDGAVVVDTMLDREYSIAKTLKEKDSRIAELQAAPATIIELPSHFGTGHLTEYFRDASAGAGIFILGNESASKIAIPDSDWDERTDYVIRVNGGSMEPDYMDGDNVMVSQHMELNYGDIGIFVVNGKAYIKEYGDTELISRNPDFPNITVHESDNIVCMGKVIGKLEGEHEIISD